MLQRAAPPEVDIGWLPLEEQSAGTVTPKERDFHFLAPLLG
jgi:hypothetical protein